MHAPAPSLFDAAADWRVFDTQQRPLPAADELLRIDPALLDWLFGDDDALDGDPRVRPVQHAGPWPGAGLIAQADDIERAAQTVAKLCGTTTWSIFGGADAADWRAVWERGADEARTCPLRTAIHRASTTRNGFRWSASRTKSMRGMTP